LPSNQVQHAGHQQRQQPLQTQHSEYLSATATQNQLQPQHSEYLSGAATSAALNQPIAETQPPANSDLLDQHVEYYLLHHPGVRESRGIQKKRAGCYEINGRQVKLDWEHDDPEGGDGFLVVVDGPLRQAFKDYVSGRDSGAVYNSNGLKRSNLDMVPKDSRMTFQDHNVVYNRLEAMKVAKEQAVVREKAALCVNSGETVPSDLRQAYEQTMDSKLGKSRLAYEESKKRWSQKAQKEGIKMYPQHAPPGLHPCMNESHVIQIQQPSVFESKVAQGGYQERQAQWRRSLE